MYVSQGVLYELFLPTVINHFSADDPTDIDIKLSGVLAESLIDTTFMSFPLSEVLNDFCTFVSESENSPFPAGKTVPADTFATNKSNQAKPQPPTEKPISIVRIPFIIPKLKGSTITPGSIKDDKVVESVADYHDVAEAWISAHVNFKKFTKNLAPKLLTAFLPSPIAGGKLCFKTSVFPTIEVASSTTSVALREKLHIIRQRLRNKVQLLEQAKNQLSPFASPAGSAPRTPPLRPFLAQASDSATPATDAKLKNKHYLSAYQLLLSNTSVASDGSTQLILRNLSAEFLEAINSPTIIEGVKLFILAFQT